jgi:hypothetical protein
MDERKSRPLLHASERRLRGQLMAACAAMLGVAAGLAGLAFCGAVPEHGLRFEVYKLLLQFFLITGGGGVLLTVVGNLRDEAVRRQARAAGISELDRELDRAYRRLSKAQRSLRAHSARAGAEGSAWRVPRTAFERAMEELLEAQLQLEVICDHIGQRDDVLFPWRLERMKAPLGYASRYYQDVHEDFEGGHVRLDGDDYDLGAAPNLTDFLRSRGDAPPLRPAAVAEAMVVLADSSRTIDARWRALRTLADGEAGGDGPDGDGGPVRYADVAAACLGLLSAELAEARRNILS